MKHFTQKWVCYRQPGTYDVKPPCHGHPRALPAAARGARGRAEGPDLHCRAFPAQPISQTPFQALTRNEVKKERAILCHQKPGAMRHASARCRFSTAFRTIVCQPHFQTCLRKQQREETRFRHRVSPQGPGEAGAEHAARRTRGQAAPRSAGLPSVESPVGW